MQDDWSKKAMYAFSPFSIIPRVLKIVQGDQVKTMILCTFMAGTSLGPRIAKITKAITISDFFIH